MSKALEVVEEMLASFDYLAEDKPRAQEIFEDLLWTGGWLTPPWRDAG